MILSRTRPTSARSATLGAVMTAAALASCSSDEAPGAGADGPYVVATTSIWADVVGGVACDDTFTVRTLVPAGVDAHGYEPSLRDREVLDGAALVVANGLGLESLLDDTLDEVTNSGTPMFHVGDHVSVLDAHHADDEHADDDDEHGDVDPHIWFDPARVAGALAPLGDALVDAGADRAAVDECVTTATAQLRELDAEVEALLAPIPPERRLLVTNHDALGYLADRYDLEILGTVLPSASTLAEASPAALETLATAIDDAGVPAIFTETLHSSDDAEALGNRLGVEVVELYSDALGPAGGDAATYADLLRTDARLIADAMTERPTPWNRRAVASASTPAP